VAQIVDVALDRLGRDVELPREGAGVGGPAILDLVVDGLEASPQRTVLERTLAAHARILSPGLAPAQIATGVRKCPGCALRHRVRCQIPDPRRWQVASFQGVGETPLVARRLLRIPFIMQIPY